ncbi:unnamed protein product [Rhodiola kirilowii]
MGRHRRQIHAATITTALAFLLFASASSILTFTQQPDGSGTDTTRDTSAATSSRAREETERVVRRLIGPGSYPPSCRSKCGRCVPCRPVHVPIQPGLSKPLEYYPEAWRCKCGNNLFMP